MPDQPTSNGDDGGPDEERDQKPVDRHSRQTGGDAPAAGSLAEREQVAEDDDELFGDG